MVYTQIQNITKKIVKSFINKPVLEQAYTKDLLFQVEPFFQNLYQEGLLATGTPASGAALVNKREARFYNLTNIYSLTASLPGHIAELGCWRGLSSYVLNSHIRQHDKNYSGEGYWIIDSFEGLSDITNSDTDLEVFVPEEVTPCCGNSGGSFSAEIDQVKSSLHEFPRINYIKGWVPEVLALCPQENQWKFVHIDLDLYEPIKCSFDFFSERMVGGGVILIDDYGSLYWPGARKAVDEIVKNKGGVLVKLSTGQAFWQAPR